MVVSTFRVQKIFKVSLFVSAKLGQTGLHSRHVLDIQHVG